jgi:uncharacterized protein (TIGR02996 family)
MPTEADFLAVIAAEPDDDTHRLVFADWLEDQGENDRAEFIRLQLQLGDTDRDKNRRSTPVVRERQLLEAHETAWFGALQAIKDEGFEYTTRRGFVEGLVVPVGTLAEHGDAIARECPVLTDLSILMTEAAGDALVRASCFKTVRTLRLEGWPTPDDVAALARSPNLERLESLSVWLGSQRDEVVCRALAHLPNTPALRRVELIQLRGGMLAGDQAAALAGRAAGLATLVDLGRGHGVAVVSTPFDTLFPLGPEVGLSLSAGLLPDGRQVLALCTSLYGDRCPYDLFYFSAEGQLTGAERVELTRTPATDPGNRGSSPWSIVLWEGLGQRMGFRPGMIRVREFAASTVIPRHYLAVYKFGGLAAEVIENPDALDTCGLSPQENIADVRFWLRTSNFAINTGNECWADERGRIHST